MSAQPKYLRTPDEYLAFERSSPEKHEYYQGEIFRMGGASNPHNIISVNIIGALRTQTRGKSCRVYASDMRTFIPTGLYTYPDVLIVCGKPEFLDNVFDTLLNPVVIIEILSGSTKNYDRTKKFDHYRSIPSLKAYVLVEQDFARVEIYSRIDDDNVPPERTLWAFQAASSLEETLHLAVVDCTINLADVYEDVELGEQPSEAQ
ncbi:MAG: Uma2 family endonuclease [Candidatus Kapabacteria bacterium]|jgi:Uma2 family endonuclease|nr:Uma2 family endonuclease [Candidatus Kapabacteria bacterium]